MNFSRESRRRNSRSRGFSLVELMISIVIGLIVLAAVASVFVSSRQTFKTQESLAQLQEAGRLVNLLFYPYVRQAGYLPHPLLQREPEKYFPPNANPKLDKRALRGFNNLTKKDAEDLGINLAAPGTDVIVTRFFGQGIHTVPGGDEKVELDKFLDQLESCVGRANGNVNLAYNQMAESIFYIRERESKDPKNPSDLGVSSLSCLARIYKIDGETDPNGAPIFTLNQPLVLGVQGMQILYGVDSDNDRSPNEYVEAGRVEAVAGWENVVSVQIAITVAGARAADYSLANSDLNRVDVAGRLQRTFTTTLQIRNLLTN